jgi:hypothetical protein
METTMGTLHRFPMAVPADASTDIPQLADPPADSREARFNTVFGSNKQILLHALSGAGITHILVCFNGNDGFRDIVSFEARAGTVLVDLPLTPVDIIHLLPEPADPASMTVPLPKAIQILTFGLLDECHDGWHRDYGAYGDLTIDVAAQHIHLTYDERWMTSERSEHQF